MANTTFTTNNALTKKAWDEKLFRETEKESFFNQSGFEGTSADSLIHVKTQLEKGQGDKVTFGLAKRLEGGFIQGETQLEGNEEALTEESDSVTLDLYRMAVRDKGALTRKRAMFSIDEEAKLRLKNKAAENLDQFKFDTLFGSFTRVVYKTSAGFQKTTSLSTATSGITVAADSKLTPEFISAMKTYAKTGNDREFNPLRPIKIKGKNYYVLLVHDDVAYDLRTNSTLMSAWENARERGESNPLFQNAVLMWDGVIVHSNEKCPIATNGGGGSIPYSKAIFMGAQSLVWAWGERPQTIQETFDYQNEHGYAWHAIFGAKKPTFDSEQYGSIGVIVSRTRISG